MSLLAGQRLVVLDFETTGWSPDEGHSAVEVARVTLESGEIADSWSSLVGPRRPIAADATRVHGITEEMLSGAPEPPAIARTLRDACGDLPLVFHNASFDLPFLGAFLRAGGLPAHYRPVIDTLGLARGLFGAGSNSLGALAARLEVPREQAHRALGDARTTARLLVALAPQWERERGVRSIEELAAASQDAIRLTARATRSPDRAPVPAPARV